MLFVETDNVARSVAAAQAPKLEVSTWAESEVPAPPSITDSALHLLARLLARAATTLASAPSINTDIPVEVVPLSKVVSRTT
jgi:hypothetical protein